MKCPKCGALNDASSKFCSNCGNQLPTAGETTKSIPMMTEDMLSALDLDSGEAEAVRQLSPGTAMLVIRRGSGAGSRYMIDTDVTSVGRHPDSAIFLDDITVSRHHAKFVWDGNTMVVEDLGSLNGTYVNNTLVEGAVRLKIGDEVRIGKYQLMYFVGECGVA